MKRALAYVLAATLSLCAGCTPIAAPPKVTPAPPTPTVVETPTDTPPPTLAESAEPTPTPTATPGPVIEKTVDRWFGPGWVDKSPYGNLGEMTYLYQTDDMSMIVNYPYLVGETEDHPINQIFRDEVSKNWTPEEGWDVRVLGGTVDSDWHAARSDNDLLSVRFREEYYITGAAHPGWYEWAVTLDRKNEKLLTLDDLVDTGDDFEAWLYAQDWTALNHWQGGGDEIGKDKEYIEYQLPFYIERSADPAEHMRDLYLTETDLVIIIWDFKYDTHLSVPLSDLTLKGDDLWKG